MKQVLLLIACWLPLSSSALPTSETSGSILNSFSNPFASKNTPATPMIQYGNPKITIEYELNGTKVCHLQTSNHKTAYIDHDNQLKFMELPKFYEQQGELKILKPTVITAFGLLLLFLLALVFNEYHGPKSNTTTKANAPSTTQ